MTINDISFREFTFAYGQMTNNFFMEPINLSGIFTEIIKEAGKCVAWASDILYEIADIRNALSLHNVPDKPVYFGFRDMGVDGETFMHSRLQNGGISCYRRIFKLEFSEPDEYGAFTATLYDWRRMD